VLVSGDTIVRWAAVSVLAIAACDRHTVVVRAGDTQRTIEELKQRIAALPPAPRTLALADLRAYVVSTVQEPALAIVAKRRGLASTAALERQIAAECASVVRPTDLTDADLLPFYANNPRASYPDRVQAIAAIFTRPSDAERFTRLARGASGAESFRVLFGREQARAPGAETWDVYLARASGQEWPAEVVEAAFATKQGDAVGPIRGESQRYAGPRYYVLYVLQKLAASNTFEQVKEGLRHDAYQARVLADTKRALGAVALDGVSIDEQALEALRRALES
jgi:hypothetical protein